MCVINDDYMDNLGYNSYINTHHTLYSVHWMKLTFMILTFCEQAKLSLKLSLLIVNQF